MPAPAVPGRPSGSRPARSAARPVRTPTTRRTSGTRRSPQPRRPTAIPRIAALAALLASLLGGCLPIPSVQRDLQVAPPSYRVSPDAVEVEWVRVEGYPEPRTPPELNASGTLRFRAPGDPPPGTVLILMPGIFGGAASFDGLARQLVASTPSLEVWAVDRRANGLEDRSVLVEALAAGDADRAYGYYVERFGRDDGFRPVRPEDAAFMAGWGLEVHLQDLHRIVLAAEERAPTVVLGGHSLGAALASLYLSYRVAPASELEYGYERVDGLVLLDGALGRTGAFSNPEDVVRVGPVALTPTEAQMRAGAPPWTEFGTLSPRGFAERAAIAVAASVAPEEAAPVPPAGFPITNRALAGVRNDDDYAVTPIFSASLGEALGAEFDGNLGAVILSGLEGVYSRSVVGVAPEAEIVRWGRGDPMRERVDMDDYLRAWTHPDSDFVEWYFPLRLGVDLTRVSVDLADQDGFLSTSRLPTPTLALGAGRGLIPTPSGFEAYANTRYGAPIAAFVLPGLTHIDIVAAENNPAVPILRRWLGYTFGTS